MFKSQWFTYSSKLYYHTSQNNMYLRDESILRSSVSACPKIRQFWDPTMDFTKITNILELHLDCGSERLWQVERDRRDAVRVRLQVPQDPLQETVCAYPQLLQTPQRRFLHRRSPLPQNCRRGMFIHYFPGQTLGGRSSERRLLRPICNLLSYTIFSL